MEYKLETNSLDLRTIMELLRSDYSSCQPERPLIYLSRNFDKYLMKILSGANQKEKEKLTYSDLELL